MLRNFFVLEFYLLNGGILMQLKVNKHELRLLLQCIPILTFATLASLGSLLPSVVEFSAAVILACQVVIIASAKGIKKNIGLLWIPLMIFIYVRNNPNIKFNSLTSIQILLLFICCILFAALGGFNDRTWMKKMVSSFRYLYFVYIAFTIYMFLDGSAVNFVCNLFPNAASTILKQYYGAGIPGLTMHYSTNGMLLAAGLMIFGSYALTEKRWSNYILFLISTVALLLTGKRAHIIFGFTALYLCYFVYNSNAKKSRLIKCIGVFLGALSAFAVASYFVPALGTVVNRFVETTETGDMSVGRVDVWLKAFSIFGKHSIVGIGWGQYVYQGGWFWNIHNIYLQLLVETGIIGFIIYCGWFLFHLIRTWLVYSKMSLNRKDYTNTDYCLMNFSLAMQIFFLLYGFTGNPLYDREMFVPYFIACAISVFYANLKKGVN